MLKTETPSTAHTELDLYALPDLIDALVDDQARAASAVRAAAPELALAVEAALPRIQAGGRLFYVGAGTSGRLGVLDSVELHPTFSWPRERALALIAGGEGAMFVAVEGAEDDYPQGADDLHHHAVGPDDVVLLIAASGTTPYVLGALQAAQAAGALTIGIANNPGTPVVGLATPRSASRWTPGPKMVSGSTRLKAGSAQKIALNTFSTALMVRLHKVYGNLMVDLRATNRQAGQACAGAHGARHRRRRAGRRARAARQRLSRQGGHRRAARGGVGARGPAHGWRPAAAAWREALAQGPASND
jgi:N-acetylmuramic acid 6-phosphate etherase